MMIAKGQKINDRYEIIRTIGEGGMANVYLAHDVILDRMVAVKILRGDLADDEKFVRRFQREAISASSLGHPNIVEMYDVGEDNGKYFIVMEYVDGKTLKSLIKKRGALTLPEVVDIMLQLTSAIAHAHESYIIHRDIKPQNVMILEDGIVKITDFGIAMALNSNEITQTNSVMGSVYYMPPEQANGNGSTTKSDIYSLGILMYELVTGKVPFKGDSAVEIAIKQMKDKIPSVCELDPGIPQAVENVILKATAKNPKNRYVSIEEMHDDLMTVLDSERNNEKKVIYNYPESNYDEEKETEEEPKQKRSERIPENVDDEKENKKINKAIWIVGGIITFLVTLIIFFLLIFPKITDKADIKIPDVSDMPLDKAEKILEEAGLEVANKTEEEESEEIDEGRVIGTEPEAKRTVKKGTKITLVVSSGSKKIEIEDYTGKNYYEIKAKLEVYGVKVITDEKDISEAENIEENTIVSQDVKAGEKLGKGDTITLVVPNIYAIYPDFVSEGYTVAEVTSFCNDNGVVLEVIFEESSKKEGTILSQSQKAGAKVIEGANLRIKVAEAAKEETSKEDPSKETSTQNDGSSETE